MRFLFLLIALVTYFCPLFSADINPENRSTVMQVLLENQRLFAFVSYRDACALLITCKGCYKYTAHASYYRQRNIDFFNQDKDHFIIENESFFITIDPNSVIFDKSGDYCIGYSISKERKPNSPAPSHLEYPSFYYYKHYTFNYHTRNVIKHSPEYSAKIMQSIATPDRILSVIISQSTIFTCSNYGCVRTWHDYKPIKLENLPPKITLSTDNNSIICTGTGTAHDKPYTRCIITHKNDKIEIQYL